MEIKQRLSIFWLRRDLRLNDNAALYYALKSEHPVLPLFIFDTEILDKLPNKKDARVHFIYNTLASLHGQLNLLGSGLLVKHGNPIDVWPKLMQEYDIAEVYTNHDYEKYAINRDEQVRGLLNSHGIGFYTFKDQVIFEKNEVLTGTGQPYTVFTPYSKKWKEKLNDFYLKSYPTEKYFNRFYQIDILNIPSLNDIGFEESGAEFPPPVVADSLVEKYGELRNFPALPATSRLSIHLRFGTVSIRELVRKAIPLSTTWLNELIWREFYMNILFHFPHVNDGQAFRKEYDGIEWRNNEEEFKRWCQGKTGYPIVDAGMRELNTTGFMHNRVRMITASFLIKHLLIDWRWGEAYFAEKLLDFDFAANNGGWQWAAGSGCDAAPYFRVFSPTAQTEKFDADLKYIKKWVPELNSFSYPKPMVDHAFARDRALSTYKAALGDKMPKE